jgi:hypothetical protein
MRKILTLVAVMALAGCGGGGGGSAPQQPAPPPTAPNNGAFVTPQFIIVIPARTSSSKSRTPQYVSAATASVKITLTANSAGATGINPVVTDISPTCGGSGCTATVNGPPSPPGTDSFLVQTFDATAAAGHTLNAGQLNNVTITAGQNNPETVTLGAVPSGTLSIAALPTTWNAGTTGQNATLSISATDGHGDTIPAGRTPAVKFVDANGNAVNVTVSDPDAHAHGTCVAASTSSCTSLVGTSVTFSGPDDTATFNYDGLAENPVQLSATLTGATTGNATFEPILQTPVFNSSQATPTGVALTSSPEIDLFAPNGGGTGSTGSESFTESGWTNAPYNNALTVGAGGACTGTATALSQIATMSAGSNSTTNGTPITATAVASPVTGSCPATVSDGLTLNSTEKSITLTVTYTTTGITAQSKRRQ